MLVSGDRLLQVAKEHHFAIPAFNAGSGQLFTATLEKAEELQAPFIMAIHPTELDFLRDSFVAQVIDAANHTDLPIALHLDHGASYEQVIHAIHLGFTSVMIDASLTDYEHNVALTKKVVEAAHATGVSVEAELGTIADTGNDVEGHLTDNVKYTDPETAKEIMDLLDDINKAGTTILMATHAKDIVDTMKKRVIAIEGGEIARDEKRGMYEDEN